MAAEAKTNGGTATTVDHPQGPSLLDSIVSESASRYMPTLTVKQFSERERMLREIKDMLVGPTPDNPQGIDYGVIPGTTKPTLLKPGAEKICTFFGYAPHYEITAEIEDWSGERFGEPLFYYRFSCQLRKNGEPVGEGIGSASTWESKYRYRTAGRKCPGCGAEAIIKGKEEYGGGWLCFAKKGGCGAKYKAGDPAIDGQTAGKVANPDIADVINTVQKMGQKRAYIAACLSATGASQYFTQDVEDIPAFGVGVDRKRIDTGGHPIGTKAAAQAVAERKIAKAKGKSDPTRERNPSQAPPVDEPQPQPIPDEILAMWGRMTNLGSIYDVFGELKKALYEVTGSERPYYEILSQHGFTHANDAKQLGMTKSRACARSLYEYVTSCATSVEPTPISPSDDREDWVPDIIRSTA